MKTECSKDARVGEASTASNRFKLPTSIRFASIALQEVEQHYKRLRSKVIKQKDETAVKLWNHKKGGGVLNSYFKGRSSNAAAVVEIEKGGKKEPKSGMSFPGKVCLAGDKSSCVDLAGVGVRKKRLAGIKDIKAYAVGVYFSNNDIRRTAHERAVTQARANDEEPVEKLLNGVMQKGKNIIRLVVVFPRATGNMISRSLDDQIGNKLKKSGHYKDFEDFSTAFVGEKFRKGTVITFSAAKNGTLTTFIDGQKKNSVRSLPVCNALVDLYLDKETITKDLRADTLGNISKFLSQVK